VGQSTFSEVLEARGGLVGRADLARLWGVSSTRIAQLVSSDDFPPEVCRINGQSAFSLAEVEAWRRGRRGPGRPKKEQST
jgi:predicted DNA-binding transcriptional regulator AlpA